ncbi:MAG: hypothetical protein KBG30_01615 [Bacteroidales bacterium]|jgi:hypothetical protein|nr:hypothetical protein [Bacteroidales bacterium]
METGITPNDIERFAKRVIQTSPKTRDIAKKITKKNIDYSKNDTEKIIISFLQRSKYDGKCVSDLVELHPDKKIFDVYYKNKYENKKVEEKPKKEETVECAACMTFAAEGDVQSLEQSELKKLATSKNLMIASGALLVVAISIAALTK